MFVACWRPCFSSLPRRLLCIWMTNCKTSNIKHLVRFLCFQNDRRLSRFIRIFSDPKHWSSSCLWLQNKPGRTVFKNMPKLQETILRLYINNFEQSSNFLENRQRLSRKLKKKWQKIDLFYSKGKTRKRKKKQNCRISYLLWKCVCTWIYTTERDLR